MERQVHGPEQPRPVPVNPVLHGICQKKDRSIVLRGAERSPEVLRREDLVHLRGSLEAIVVTDDQLVVVREVVRQPVQEREKGEEREAETPADGHARSLASDGRRPDPELLHPAGYPQMRPCRQPGETHRLSPRREASRLITGKRRPMMPLDPLWKTYLTARPWRACPGGSDTPRFLIAPGATRTEQSHGPSSGTERLLQFRIAFPLEGFRIVAVAHISLGITLPKELSVTTIQLRESRLHRVGSLLVRVCRAQYRGEVLE